jgi:Protein of unknown function (DUF2934)
MADTPKKRTSTKAPTANKSTTAAKPRKAPAKKSTNGVADPVSINGHAVAQERSATHDEVARLAHTYWQQRGGNHGYHIDDWFRAEQELRSKAS